MVTTQASSNSVQDQLKALARTPQFYWWIGHLLTLLFTVLTLVTFNSVQLFYKLAFIGALMSYGIVIRSSHQEFNFSMECAARVFSDENFSYTFLAIYWLINEPVLVAMFPFALYSVFHFIGYFRSTILLTLYPNVKQELESKTQTPSLPTRLHFTLGKFAEKYSVKTIQLASFLEVSLVPIYLLLRVTTRFRSIFSLFFYGQFLRQRASQSAQTRASFNQLAAILDRYILQSAVPTQVQNIYIRIKAFMSSLIIQIPSANHTQ